VIATIEKVRSDASPPYILASVEGLPRQKLFEEFREGQTVDGTVAMKIKGGVLIDFNCERFGFLLGSRKDVFKLRDGEHVEGMRVEDINAERGQIRLSYPDLSDHVAGREERQYENAGFGYFRPLDKVRAPEDLTEGDTIEGRVVRMGGKVYVDFGGPRMARVLAPRREASRKLSPGEVVKARIEKVRPAVILASVSGLTKLKLFEDLELGQTIDGVVAKKNDRGVLLDIGFERFGFLLGDREDVSKLETDERLEGLKIEKVDAERGEVLLSLASLPDIVAGREGGRSRREGRRLPSPFEEPQENSRGPPIVVGSWESREDAVLGAAAREEEPGSARSLLLGDS